MVYSSIIVYSLTQKSHDLRFIATGSDVIFGYTSRNLILTAANNSYRTTCSLH